MALLAGIDYADDADVIVMMDSDLKQPPGRQGNKRFQE
jgi:hypothetical protein